MEIGDSIAHKTGRNRAAYRSSGSLAASPAKAMRIRARAIRRCGEVLDKVEKAHGKRTDLEHSGGGPTKFARSDAAKEAGLSPDQAKDAIRVARVPAESTISSIC